MARLGEKVGGIAKAKTSKRKRNECKAERIKGRETNVLAAEGEGGQVERSDRKKRIFIMLNMEQMRLNQICKENEIHRHGWKVNNFTLYLVESGSRPGRVASIMNVNRATVQHWLVLDKLSGTVDFLFFIARKMRLMDMDPFSNV